MVNTLMLNFNTIVLKLFGDFLGAVRACLSLCFLYRELGYMKTFKQNYKVQQLKPIRFIAFTALFVFLVLRLNKRATK